MDGRTRGARRPANGLAQDAPATVLPGEQFGPGIIANAMVGGDNCHRGAVVSSILATANVIDERWTAGLKALQETSAAT